MKHVDTNHFQFEANGVSVDLLVGGNEVPSDSARTIDPAERKRWRASNTDAMLEWSRDITNRRANNATAP